MSALYLLDSPHSLNDRIFHALRRQPHLCRRPIRYAVIDQDVVLTGRVETYYQKQMAQESLRPITGIRRIVNDLEVICS